MTKTQSTAAMNFGHALQALRDGHKVARTGWNGKGMWIENEYPTALSKMTLPYTFMKTATGDLIPWLCSQADMHANDWLIVE